jgi:tRNA (guanine-N7-)-methyltransferase
MSHAEAAMHRREIRSFVRREGRMTDAQKRAIDELWPRYGVDAPAAALDLAALFGREAPVALEIGFGNGEHLLGRAGAEPDKDFLGVEVHRPGVGRVLMRAKAEGLKNLRVACADAVEVLRDWLAPACLAEILIYFPDPWPKKRHHKRRLVQPEFAALLASRLQPGGVLRLATDWKDYADHMLAVLDAERALRGGLVPRPAARPVTKFERRGEKLGHGVFDLVYTRVG